jgi:hypothetical protein
MQTVDWKIILIIALFVSFLFFSFTAVKGLRDRTISFQPKTQSRVQAQPLPPPAKAIRLYPSLPANLPDLNEGYLFNQERNLKPPETGAGVTTENEFAIDMDEVLYDGSLIIGSARKALIRYPTIGSQMTGRRMGTLPKRVMAEKWSSRVVEEGDTFSGYRVVSISPQAIVFEKDDGQVEKNLYTPDKDRAAFIPPMNRSAPPAEKAFRKSTKSSPGAIKTRAINPVKKQMPVRNRATARN